MEDRIYTIEDWAALEAERSDVRYEYVEGLLVAMAGGSPRHALVKDNVAAALRGALGRACLVMTSDVRVRTAPARYRLPDVVAVCAERVRTEPIPGLAEAVTNPAVLVEVLSEKTATTDHEAKLQEYLALPSVVEYWVVNPEAKAFVMQYRKDAAHGEGYRLTLYTALEAELLSDELGGLRIPIRALYDQVERTP